MVKSGDMFRDCIGFEWDEGNALKNRKKHCVTQSECEQVFFNRPFVLQRDSSHSEHEPRFYVLGQTDMNRMLFVVFVIRSQLIRIISARDMTQTEERRFQK